MQPGNAFAVPESQPTILPATQLADHRDIHPALQTSEQHAFLQACKPAIMLAGLPVRRLHNFVAVLSEVLVICSRFRLLEVPEEGKGNCHLVDGRQGIRQMKQEKSWGMCGSRERYPQPYAK
jgi:hypothetical protein